MNAVNYSDLRQNLKHYLHQVYENHETLIVARKNNENVVMISIEEYNSLMETLHLLSTEANAKHLADSILSAKAGRATDLDSTQE